MTQPLYRKLAGLLLAIDNCEKSGNSEWQKRHTATLFDLVAKHMPSGSGFDRGTKLLVVSSEPENLVFETSFHHMNETGTYDGWTEHLVSVKPSLVHGFTLKVSGRDRNEIKSLISEVFWNCLTTEVE
jgi:hypothetical protein